LTSDVLIPRGEEETAMARYYLDIVNGTQSVRDDEGTEFHSVDAAVQGAARSAAEIGANRLARGDFSDVVVEVRDEQDQRVFTVRASMRSEAHGPRRRGPIRGVREQRSDWILGWG